MGPFDENKTRMRLWTVLITLALGDTGHLGVEMHAHAGHPLGRQFPSATAASSARNADEEDRRTEVAADEPSFDELSALMSSHRRRSYSRQSSLHVDTEQWRRCAWNLVKRTPMLHLSETVSLPGAVPWHRDEPERFDLKSCPDLQIVGIPR